MCFYALEGVNVRILGKFRKMWVGFASVSLILSPARRKMLEFFSPAFLNFLNGVVGLRKSTLMRFPY